MSPFIETIRIEAGQISNLPYHNLRMNATRRAFFGTPPALDLADYIVPTTCQVRTKCRVEYAETILSVTYAPYHRRPVHSLRLVEASALDYRFKSMDREKLNVLFNLRGEEDDILMVRDGLLTDTSICNIALWKDKEWLTPRYPLLEGTMRACLLASGQIRMADIRPADLLPRARIRLFNALIDFGELEIVI